MEVAEESEELEEEEEQEQGADALEEEEVDHRPSPSRQWHNCLPKPNQ